MKQLINKALEGVNVKEGLSRQGSFFLVGGYLVGVFAVFFNGQFVWFDFVSLRVVKFDFFFLNCPDV